MFTEEENVTLTPRIPDAPSPWPMVCFRCGVTPKVDPTVYARVTITGEHHPPLCMSCAVKLDRMARLARRGDCAA